MLSRRILDFVQAFARNQTKNFVLALAQCQITTVSDVLLGITLYPTDAVRALVCQNLTVSIVSEPTLMMPLQLIQFFDNDSLEMVVAVIKGGASETTHVAACTLLYSLCARSGYLKKKAQQMGALSLVFRVCIQRYMVHYRQPTFFALLYILSESAAKYNTLVSGIQGVRLRRNTRSVHA